MRRLQIVICALAFFPAGLATAGESAHPYGDPTPEEQLMLELINRARADPEAERVRLGVPTEEWPGYAPRPPLVMNAMLLAAARRHARDMHDRAFFSHMNPDGVNANARLREAGYPLAKDYGANENNTENTAAGFPTGEEAQRALMIDEGTVPPNHRLLVLSHEPFWADNDEVGLGIHHGKKWYLDYYAQEFARDDDRTPHLLGVVYRDANGNGFYDIGEGVNGVTVSIVDGGRSTRTASAGGFGMDAPPPGEYLLRASGAGVTDPVDRPLVVEDRNVKVDFVLGPEPPLDVLRSSFVVSLSARKAGEPSDRVKVKARLDRALLPEALDGVDVTIDFGGVRVGAYSLVGKGRGAAYRSPKDALPRVSIKVSRKTGKLVFKCSKADLIGGLGLDAPEGADVKDVEIRVSMGEGLDVAEVVRHVLKVRLGRLVKGASRR